MERYAQITTVDLKRQQLLRVAVPTKISAKELGIVHDSILERIRDLTGCACLSGVIDVILEERFQDVINVELPGG